MWKFLDQSILGGANELHRQHAHSVQQCSVTSLDCLLPCREQLGHQIAEMYVFKLLFCFTNSILKFSVLPTLSQNFWLKFGTPLQITRRRNNRLRVPERVELEFRRYSRMMRRYQQGPYAALLTDQMRLVRVCFFCNKNVFQNSNLSLIFRITSRFDGSGQERHRRKRSNALSAPRRSH
jgi:hypothetical protein